MASVRYVALDRPALTVMVVPVEGAVIMIVMTSTPSPLIAWAAMEPDDGPGHRRA